MNAKRFIVASLIIFGFQHPMFGAFVNWSVVSGSVDLIGHGLWDFFPTHGLYLDLDGTTGQAGTLLSSSPYSFESGKTYTLQFDLAGNRRGDHYGPDAAIIQVQVNLGSIFNKTYSLSADSPFVTISEEITVSSDVLGMLNIQGIGGDNVGMLLDNVILKTHDSYLLLDTFDNENGGVPAYNYTSAGQLDFPDLWPNPIPDPPVVPEPSTYVAGILLLLPFGVNALRMFRRKAN